MRAEREVTEGNEGEEENRRGRGRGKGTVIKGGCWRRLNSYSDN